MSSLYLTGGRQRKLVFKNEEEQRLYEAALLLRMDTGRDTSELVMEYKSPPEARASEESSNVFKSSTLEGNRFYTCTSTEVLIFELPDFRRVGYISLPCFNDLHHVTPTRDGNLLVANTGLDMVVKFTHQGRVLNYWNVLGGDPWSRFSPDVDYRKVDSTKPHDSHPNAAFELDQDVWVTRLKQRDAICLTSPGRRINIEVQKPHDGLLWNGRLYFTTVDGRIVIADPQRLAVEQIIDLHEIHRIQTQEETLLGWCRSILPVDERRIWVGFTRVRKTKFMENLLWIKQAFQDKSKPTHLGLYDIVERRCLQEIDLERHGMNVIFGICNAANPGDRP
ncbi:MAG TPA: hypothetical protein VFA67_11415 [Candidatus Sulfotelmatobacter sp.]|nr:hypothetical protein [Candidatus Sulfotelmatobacter sp.]